MAVKRRPCRRTFRGIQFTHVRPGLWKSDDGIELMKGNIFVKWDRWSVEHNPRVKDPRDSTAPHGRRASGFTAEQALKDSGL